MIKKICKFMAMVMLTVSLSVFAGCNRGGANDSRVIFTFTDELEDMMEMYYEAHPEIPESERFTISIVDYNDISNQLNSRFRTGNNIPAIVALEEKPSRNFIERNLFVELDDLVTDDNDMYDYTFSSGKFNGKQFGLSWQATPGGFYFRTDIAKEYIPTYLGITSNSTVNEVVAAVQTKISTWDGFIELAGKLYEASEGGIKILSSNNDPSRVFIANREHAWVEVENGKEYLRIDPSIREYFELIKALEVGSNPDNVATTTKHRYVNGSNDSDTTWFADMNTTVANYKASRADSSATDDLNLVFGYFLPTWGLHYQLKSNGAATSGKWGVTAGPEAFSDGGTWLAVTDGLIYEKEAKDIVKYLTTDKAFLKAWADRTGDFVNSKSVMQDISDDFTGEAFLGGQNHYEIFMDAAESNKPGPLSKYDVYISNTAVRSWAANYGVGTNGKNVGGITSGSPIENYFQAFADTVKSYYPNIDITQWNKYLG